MSDMTSLKEHFSSLTVPMRALIEHRLEWLDTSRPCQIPPQTDFSYLLNLSGRGTGKTRMGAEDVVWYCGTNPRSRYGVVAATQDDIRKTCFEGESGVLANLPEVCYAGGSQLKGYNKSTLEIQLWNGAYIGGKSAEKPGRLRGPQWHRAWADELAEWGDAEETWSNLEFGLRLGSMPQAIITTTPKPKAVLLTIMKDPKLFMVNESIYANKDNLAPKFLNDIITKYEGTSKGEQEIHGKLILESEDALWTRATLDRGRLPRVPGGVTLIRIVVAIDPAVTTNDKSDHTGIVVAGLGDDGHGYVLADFSGKMKPNQWARKAIAAYSRFKADKIIGEANNGGDLVITNIKNYDPTNGAINIDKVIATRGKHTRAEPIAMLYEQNRVHHIGSFSELEDQLCGWEPLKDKTSPDRLDACVWALTELMTQHVAWEF